MGRNGKSLRRVNDDKHIPVTQDMLNKLLKYRLHYSSG